MIFSNLIRFIFNENIFKLNRLYIHKNIIFTLYDLPIYLPKNCPNKQGESYKHEQNFKIQLL